MAVLRYVFRFCVVFAVVSLIYMLFGWIAFSWPKLINALLVIALWVASGDVGEIITYYKPKH